MGAWACLAASAPWGALRLQRGTVDVTRAEMDSILTRFATACKEPHEVRSNQDLLAQYFGQQLAEANARSANARNAGGPEAAKGGTPPTAAGPNAAAAGNAANANDDDDDGERT